MPAGEKPLVWLHGQIKTPPFSEEARIEAGYLLGRLQQGESLGLPHSRANAIHRPQVSRAPDSRQGPHLADRLSHWPGRHCDLGSLRESDSRNAAKC